MSAKSILLVEDNPDDVDLTLRAFRKSRIINDVFVARDGIEALDYLFETGARAGMKLEAPPAVILLDLKLPKMGGEEVLERIRSDERTSLIPVVILTSSKEDEDRYKCYLKGANSFVRKPVDFVQFVDAVRELGVYWLLLNEPPPARQRAGRNPM